LLLTGLYNEKKRLNRDEYFQSVNHWQAVVMPILWFCQSLYPVR